MHTPVFAKHRGDTLEHTPLVIFCRLVADYLEYVIHRWCRKANGDCSAKTDGCIEDFTGGGPLSTNLIHYRNFADVIKTNRRVMQTKRTVGHDCVKKIGEFMVIWGGDMKVGQCRAEDVVGVRLAG